ncbi:RNA polymerase sigma factor [Terrisporobacter sp.]|uniref:RNA polymerase sigma factor n=1 Tax=Terrisporobacter sp. TaxID=1965305 RepID=UPI002603483D|nr:RNA polymerase sigma factor [Terrisporobacter sp.]
MDKDLRLIKKIKKRNSRSAADELISNYYKEIYIYVFKQTSDKETSMDITQEIFISMLKSLDSFDENKSSFRTWLYRIATNKVVDYFRSKNYKYTNLIETIEDKQIEDITDFTVNLEHKEDVEKIQEIVNKLSSEHQEIFRLKIFLQATFLEISKILELSESTVKTKYYSIIKKIKKEFN